MQIPHRVVHGHDRPGLKPRGYSTTAPERAFRTGGAETGPTPSRPRPVLLSRRAALAPGERGGANLEVRATGRPSASPLVLASGLI